MFTLVEYVSNINYKLEWSAILRHATFARRAKRRGVYSPLAASGSLVTNGVLASNYVTRGWLKDRAPGQVLHLLQHGGTLPYRLFCKWRGGYDDETWKQGFHRGSCFGFIWNSGYCSSEALHSEWLSTCFHVLIGLVMVTPPNINDDERRCWVSGLLLLGQVRSEDHRILQC